jgi:hypothetical protein
MCLRISHLSAMSTTWADFGESEAIEIEKNEMRDENAVA